jgi:hypothetical protein
MDSLDRPVSSSLGNLLDSVNDIHTLNDITKDDLYTARCIVSSCTAVTDHEQRLTCFPSNQLVIAVVMKN